MVFPIQSDSLSLAGLTIIVNPGHGIEFPSSKGVEKEDCGATRKLANGKTIYESSLNDSCAVKIRNSLESLGAKVVYADNMNRYKIQALQDSIKPELFVSIHHDATNYKSCRGEIVYHWNKNSTELANSINNRLKADETIKNKGVRRNDYTVLKAAPSIPSALVEVGCMSNPKELEIVNSPEYQTTVSNNITNGIIDYLKTKFNIIKQIPLKMLEPKDVLAQIK